MLLCRSNGIATVKTLCCHWAFPVLHWRNALLCNSLPSREGVMAVFVWFWEGSRQISWVSSGQSLNNESRDRTRVFGDGAYWYLCLCNVLKRSCTADQIFVPPTFYGSIVALLPRKGTKPKITYRVGQSQSSALMSQQVDLTCSHNFFGGAHQATTSGLRRALRQWRCINQASEFCRHSLNDCLLHWLQESGNVY